jgi:DNA-binding MarR family transcriptional regulator
MARISPAPRGFERCVDGIRYGVLDDLVGYALRRAQIAIYVDFETALGPLDMTPQRFSAMVVIAENAGRTGGRIGGITQRDLGRVLGIARSGVVQVVDALAARDWVTRERDAEDARAWRLMLTDAGRKHLAAVRRHVRAHDRRIARDLSEPERETLIGLLAKLGPSD